MDLIKESKGIHKCLLKRWEELELKNSDIIHDAEERGFVLTKSQMSNYRKLGTSLTQAQVLWLSLRYYIPVAVQIGVAEIKDKKIQYTIPKFDEVQAIKNLNKHKDLFK